MRGNLPRAPTHLHTPKNQTASTTATTRPQTSPSAAPTRPWKDLALCFSPNSTTTNRLNPTAAPAAPLRSNPPAHPVRAKACGIARTPAPMQAFARFAVDSQAVAFAAGWGPAGGGGPSTSIAWGAGPSTSIAGGAVPPAASAHAKGVPTQQCHPCPPHPQAGQGSPALSIRGADAVRLAAAWPGGGRAGPPLGPRTGGGAAPAVHGGDGPREVAATAPVPGDDRLAGGGGGATGAAAPAGARGFLGGVRGRRPGPGPEGRAAEDLAG